MGISYTVTSLRKILPFLVKVTTESLHDKYGRNEKEITSDMAGRS